MVDSRITSLLLITVLAVLCSLSDGRAARKGVQRRQADNGEGIETALINDANGASQSGCASSPCKNGGSCDDSETPVPGQDYYCRCKKGFGGLHCGVVDPCSTCPAGYVHCITTSTNKKTARYCFGAHWKRLLP